MPVFASNRTESKSVLEIYLCHEGPSAKRVADADGIVDVQGKLLGVDVVVDAVVLRGGEVFYESPPSVLLWNNTNTRATKIAAWGIDKKALTNTIKSAIKARKAPGKARKRPRQPDPSQSGLHSKGHKSRASTRSKRAMRFHHTSSSSSSSASSSSSSSSSSSPHGRHRHSHKTCRHRHEHHCHYQRAGRHQRHHHPVPRKLRHAIGRGEFVDLSKLLSEHLTLVGSTSASHSGRSHSTRYITGLDTWLEAWSVFAGVLSPTLLRIFSNTFITRSSCRFPRLPLPCVQHLRPHSARLSPDGH